MEIMYQAFSITTLACQLLASAAIAAISYIFILAALRPSIFSLPNPIDQYENFFAIGDAAIVFTMVLWRLVRGS